MRFLHSDGTLVHLAYCTNMHMAEDLDGVITQLARYAEPVREQLGTDRLGLGLWLAAPVVAELAADSGALRWLRSELDQRGLEVVTLNAFPYAGFHAASTKKTVYKPDWADLSRLEYTLDCARILTALLPDDVVRGSISTLPFGWRADWTPERGDQARRNLDALADGLAALEVETGRTVRVALEPEPGCVVEYIAQAVEHLRSLDTDRLGVCLDICHLSVAFEDPQEAVAALENADLSIVKTQVSCALEVPEPSGPGVHSALSGFAEPRFLHQTKELTSSALLSCDDLPDAMAGGLPGADPWRVHFHVPLHADLPAPLSSTRPVLLAALDALFGGPTARTEHAEVETYTWPVLPGAERGDAELIAGVAGELAWTRDALESLGLKEV
ncbi:metabolite traffic protein EboE [Nonomuraea typhae]|uniref:Metabolite traffic protein EboE n=1 Tax=Nonomuraea typhae TaxID=2603600 RepID=A0ABW7Z9C1_9ACTN